MLGVVPREERAAMGSCILDAAEALEVSFDCPAGAPLIYTWIGYREPK
jgi:hypothetical protein